MLYKYNDMTYRVRENYFYCFIIYAIIQLTIDEQFVTALDIKKN